MIGKSLKTILGILLLLCVFPMPYSYYEFVRFVALVAFAILAYEANAEGNRKNMFIYLALALMFQPFFKLAFGRMLWNIIDVVVAIGLFYSVYKGAKHKA